MARAGQSRVEHGCRIEPGGRAGWAIAIGSVLCAGLVGGPVSPASAAEPPGEGASDVQLGSFALGDALEGTIGEMDGSFAFSLSAGGVQLAWDSRAAAVDAVGLGAGWSFGLAMVRVDGGVWVYPASGGAFAMNASVPSGLDGYAGADVVFRAAVPGAVVPARADGSVGGTPYAFVLHELGGVSTYFDAAGFPVAKLVEGGERVDWRWRAGGAGVLEAVVSADGSVTALEWSDPSRVVITPGSSVTAPVAGSGVGGSWLVELDGGRVVGVVDPSGARTTVGYDGSGLVERVSAPSGASTEVVWQDSLDGVARVDRVRLVDEATGAELSVREWGVEGVVAPSGWPLVDGLGSAGSVSAGSVPVGYETWLSDGKTRVDSVVDGSRRLVERAVVVSSGSGERVVREQVFGYPESDPGAGVSGVGARPTSVTTTHRDVAGGSRVESESYGFDELGRMVSRTTADGAVTRRSYDSVVVPERGVPVGLVVEESTTGADGLVTVSRSELSADRTAVVAAETWSGRAGGELVRTGRAESDVVQGFVTERRVFPGGDPAAVPVVTRWSKHVDVARGTKTVVQTAAAGTPIESAVSSVSSLVHGGVLAETDAVGNVTAAVYDGSGRQVSATDAAGRQVSREYRTKQVDGVNAVVVTGADGVTVTEVRDALGRVVRKSDDIGSSGAVEAGVERVFETREYAPGVERVADAWGATTTTERDVYGRVERVTLPNGATQVARFDDVAGSATSGVSLTGELADAESTTTVTHDGAGRSTTSTGVRADGVVVPESRTETDGLGRSVRVSDGRLSTSTEYDAFGNAVQMQVAPVDDAAGAVTAEREFDGFGASVEKTLRSGAETHAGQRQELDELGRVVAQTDQRGVTERTRYTPDGLVAEVVSDTGRVASFTYDEVTRALVGSRVSAPHGAAVETAYRHDGLGRVVAVFDPADEAGTLIGYEYDAFGNVTRTVYPDGTEVRHEFDGHGRKVASVDAAGNRTVFGYDEAGSLVSAVQAGPDGAAMGGVRYGYDGYGRVTSLERENGVRTVYTFTSTSQIESETTTGPGGVLSEREYAYSPTETLTTRIDRVADDAGELQATRTDYEYDAFERLLKSTVRDGEAPDGLVTTRTEYVPTVGRDLASETVTTNPDTPDAVSVTRSFEYSEVGELTAIVTGDQRSTQTFDVDGSLTGSAGGARYEYDAASRPIAQTTGDGVRIQTRYWADGSRKERVTETGSTRFYWDGVRLINEVHDTTDPAGAGGTASYLIGASRQARSIRPEGGAVDTSYYGTDRHANVTDLTDQAGMVTTRYAYTDYGVATVTGDRPDPVMPGGVGELGYNPFQYAGEYTYGDGTQSLGPRTYDPVQARFMTEDDAALANLYAYADLNPITNVDPTGRTSANDWGQIGAVLAGAAFAIGGAFAMVFTGGTALTVMGVVGGLFAGADLTIAGFELAKVFGQVEWIDGKAIEIASYSFAAVSALYGIGGIAKWATNRATKAADDAGRAILERTDLDAITPAQTNQYGPVSSAEHVILEAPSSQLAVLKAKLASVSLAVSKFNATSLEDILSSIKTSSKLRTHLDGALVDGRHVKRVNDDYYPFYLADNGSSDLSVEDLLEKYTLYRAEFGKYVRRLYDELVDAAHELELMNAATIREGRPNGAYQTQLQSVTTNRNHIGEAITALKSTGQSESLYDLT